jgi:hypothetical protein
LKGVETLEIKKSHLERYSTYCGCLGFSHTSLFQWTLQEKEDLKLIFLLTEEFLTESRNLFVYFSGSKKPHDV